MMYSRTESGQAPGLAAEVAATVLAAAGRPAHWDLDGGGKRRVLHLPAALHLAPVKKRVLSQQAND